MAFLDDDENVKEMRETAKRIGLTRLLTDFRQEQVMLLTAMDRQRARITQVLVLLGVLDPERKRQ